MKTNRLRHRRKKRLENLMKKKEEEAHRVEDKLRLFVNKEQVCERCGECCSAYVIQLTQKDLDREPKLFDVSHPIKSFEQVTRNPDGVYCRLVNTDNKNRKCPLYEDSIGCTIYETRPDVCRDFIPSHYSCLCSRLASAGFKVEPWYRNNMDAYCKTQLHHYTGLNPFRDDKAVYLYSLILPYLVSVNRVKEYWQSRKKGMNISKIYSIEDFIDVDSQIPDCIREFLHLDGEYKTIKDIFNPHALDTVLMG